MTNTFPILINESVPIGPRFIFISALHFVNFTKILFCVVNFNRFHCLNSLPGTGPGRRNNHRSGYKCKDNFLITKRNTQILSKKF